MTGISGIFKGKGVFIKLALYILVPLLAAILPLTIPGDVAKFGAVLVTMCVFWVTEALPFAVTGLIPIVAFPMLGVMTTKEVCVNYLTDTNMLFLGGLMVAVSLEHCNLHRRIALKTLLVVGQTPMRLLLSFMIIQAFLSMWISNTAATAMMVPIAEAILVTFKAKDVDSESDFKSLRDISFLGLAYAANLGGTATLTGTNPNLVLMGFLDIWYPNGTSLSYATWLGYNFPGMLACLFAGYVWLAFLLRLKTKSKVSGNESQSIKGILQTKYKECGSLSFHEKSVIVLFCILVVLWVTQAPRVVPGWGELLEQYFGHHFRIHSATPAMFIVILMFIVPAKNPFSMTSKESVYKYESCLTWKVVHEKVNWSVIILIGSGFALASAGKTSGFNQWVSDRFDAVQDLDPLVIVIIMCFATTMVTEVMSNTTTASILLPILNSMALKLEMNPLFLLMPVTLCCSYAFMLPVATPPNAIVFDAAKDMRVGTMMKCGFVMNIISTTICILVAMTYGRALFEFHTFPMWANQTLS